MELNSNNIKPSFHVSDLLWDLWCVVSIIGIWPRFIEPNLVTTTKLSLPISNLPEELKDLRILQFSDLHLHPRVPDFFLTKLISKARKLKPDLIVFTGDFLCYSLLSEAERLKKFLNSFSAPYGCFAILGNHDYQQCVSVNEKGDYDVIRNDTSLIYKGFQRLFSPLPLSKKVTPETQSIEHHQQLMHLLKETPFKLLDNATAVIPIHGTKLNLCGVGEHMLGHCKPEKAFQGYDKNYPGIILAHNPDCVPQLQQYPGDVILSGHTHGGQVNLPLMWRKFILIKNIQFKRGLVKAGKKWVYVNRGIGSVFPFRWFSVPEILLLTLE
ncbi:MAG: 3',5'-cyclic adenosine monophosphate phosphodiesterase CpdA [Chlamydiae bacterium]|nr:3',5'-cyclic adenosine monophosphate phosphodiesterase CpdA [Chlamydiota bacterium]